MFKKKIRCFAAVLAAVSVCFSGGWRARAEEIAPEVSARAAVVMEAQSGRLLYEKNAGERLPMASTTKIMTALLTLESGDADVSFSVNSRAIQVEGSSMGLTAGDQVTLRTLAYGMLLASGNDAANAAAVRVAGTIPDFVALMNSRAEQLGMKNTNFETPSGLDGEAHYSTAADMALLARAALENGDFREICRQKSAKLSYGNPPYDRWLSNHNRLLSSYDGCIGVKTGFTKAAGRCLVSAAEREGVTLICVTLRAPNDWDDHRKLLDYGFEKVSAVELPNGTEGLSFPVVGGEAHSVHPVILEKISAVLTAEEQNRVSTEIVAAPFYYAPLKAGDCLGEMRYYLDRGGERLLLGSVTLSAESSVAAATEREKRNFLKRMKGFWHRLF